MPNHVTNRLKFMGNQDRIDELVSKYSTHYKAKHKETYSRDRLIYSKDDGSFDIGWYDPATDEFEKNRSREKLKGIPEGYKPVIEPAFTQFPDFSKIRPMPESLDIQIHMGIENAVKNALSMPTHSDPFIGSLEAANREKNKSPLEFSDEEWNQFIICLNNVRRHGHIYWHDWAIENWETKWNCYECRQLENDEWQFLTAWSPVPGLIGKISEEFPDIDILYMWADEDIGSNCGWMKFFAGDMLDEFLPERQSKRAYDFLFANEFINPDEWQFIDGEYERK